MAHAPGLFANRLHLPGWVPGGTVLVVAIAGAYEGIRRFWLKGRAITRAHGGRAVPAWGVGLPKVSVAGPG